MPYTFRNHLLEKDLKELTVVMQSTGLFYDFEIDVALEVLQSLLDRGEASGYYCVPDPYYLDKKVKLVELFSYHKLGLTNKYTHLFGDS